MDVFASLNLSDQSSSRLREGAQSITEKGLPPLVLTTVCSRRSFSSADANEDANFPSWPLVYRCFIENKGCGIVRSGPFVNEDMLSDLDGLKCQSRGRCGSTSLPNRAVKFRGRLLSRIVGP